MMAMSGVDVRVSDDHTPALATNHNNSNITPCLPRLVLHSSGASTEFIVSRVGMGIISDQGSNCTNFLALMVK
jgi:hypothetical protein